MILDKKKLNKMHNIEKYKEIKKEKDRQNII